MRRTTLSRTSALGVLLLAACGAPACSSEDAPSEDLAAKLRRETGVAWGVAIDPRSQSPRILSPSAPVRLGSGTPEADAVAFFARYEQELGARGHELRLKVSERERGGGTYVRFEHFVPATNLRVFDVASMAHFDAGGAAYLVQPGFRAGLEAIPREAKVAEDAALRTATAHVAVDCGLDPNAVPSRATELGVAADENAPIALAYRVSFGQVTGRCLAPQVDIDATNGTVLRVHAGGAAFTDSAGGSRFYMAGDLRDTKNLDVSRHWHPFSADTYTLETEATPRVITQSFLERQGNSSVGRDFEQTSLGHWDETDPLGPGAAVDAHYHVTQALRYFREVHGRRGIDDKNGDVRVVVHDNPGNNNGDNAHYTTIQTPSWVFFHVTDDQVTVGDGDLWWGDKSRFHWLPLSAAFDVMAHEVAHGVTAHTSNLKYEYESGALNESFSDVMGISADQWLFPALHRNLEKQLIGEGLTIKRDAAMRDMIDPRRFDARNRSHYDVHHTCAGELPNGANDLCGVHFDSGIGNRAWSLMTLGGIHQTSGIAVTSPIGWEKARTLWYETFTRLSPQATFREAALKQLEWAWKNDPASLNAVGCAWYAVGALTLDATVSPLAASLVCPAIPVGPPAPPPPSSPSPTSSSAACAGHAGGWVCDPAAPAAAYLCDAGAAADSSACADLAARCKPLSATDPTASFDASGALVCE